VIPVRPLRDVLFALAVVASLATVGGGLLAAAGSANSAHGKTAKAGHKKNARKRSARKTPGPRGKPGATGPQGPQGPTGVPGANGSARAYGLVIGRAIPVATAGASPYLHNVTIQTGVSGSPQGTYCLAPAPGISSAGVVVTVGPAELPSSASPPPGTEIVLPYVSWLSGAPDCNNGQLEVRTFSYTIVAGNLTLSPSDYVSFSFVIP
jgi:hypothetical protein